MSSTPPDDPNTPDGQNPYGQDPYGQQPPQDPHGRPIPPQDPYSQPQYGQNPYGQNPYGQQPYGQPQGKAQYDGTQPLQRWSATDSFGWAWRAFKGNWGVLVLLTLLMGLLTGGVSVGSVIADGGFDELTNLDSTGASGGFSLASMIGNVLTMLISLLFTAAFAKAGILATRGHRLKFGDLFTDINWVQVFLVSLLTSVITMIGIVLCVLPGIIAAVLLCFAVYAVVGAGDNAIAALKTSVNLVKGAPGQVILLLLLSVLVVTAGVCACGVGFLVAYPITTLALAHAFQALRGEPIVG
ncbi:hypothetical protein [Nocardioides yefusunii]|uniref:DUF7847 domain-containing protein n=1 Tax=Nocardioides yefusunii TaxID=2500546 RepID=A0ABW1QYA6_9ACTN|nr:hypothetical protein [Nocardioides yefusunii]